MWTLSSGRGKLITSKLKPSTLYTSEKLLVNDPNIKVQEGILLDNNTYSLLISRYYHKYISISSKSLKFTVHIPTFIGKLFGKYVIVIGLGNFNNVTEFTQWQRQINNNGGCISSHSYAKYLFEYLSIQLDIGIKKNQFKHFVNGAFPLTRITWTIWPECFLPDWINHDIIRITVCKCFYDKSQW